MAAHNVDAEMEEDLHKHRQMLPEHISLFMLMAEHIAITVSVAILMMMTENAALFVAIQIYAKG